MTGNRGLNSFIYIWDGSSMWGAMRDSSSRTIGSTFFDLLLHFFCADWRSISLLQKGGFLKYSPAAGFLLNIHFLLFYTLSYQKYLILLKAVISYIYSFQHKEPPCPALPAAKLQHTNLYQSYPYPPTSPGPSFITLDR